MAQSTIFKSLFKSSDTDTNTDTGAANNDTLALIRLLTVTIVLPLLIAAMGTWGRYDHYSQYHAITAEQFQLDNLIDRFEASKTKGGNYPHSLTYEKDGTTYHGKDALIEAQITRVDVIATRIVQILRGLFPPIIVIAGATSALSALLLITVTKVATWYGDKYSSFMIANFKHIAKYVPYLLVLQNATFYISVIAGAWFFAFSFFHIEAIAFGAIKLIIILPLLIYGSVWLAKKSFHQIKKSRDLIDIPPIVLIGQEANETNATGLWELVKQAAQATASPMPDNIIIGIENGIYAMAGDKILEDQSLTPATKYISGNTLYVSLPEIALLDKTEAQAIIARELSFFGDAEIEYSQQFLPSFYKLSEYVSGLESGNGFWLMTPSIWLGQYALNHFAIALDNKRFDRALNADKNAVKIAGNETFIQALLKASAATKSINDEIGKIGVLTQPVPKNLVADICAKGIKANDCNVDLALPHPYESELPIKDRMAFFGNYELSLKDNNTQNGNVTSYFTDFDYLSQRTTELYCAYIQKDAARYKEFLSAQIRKVAGHEYAFYNLSKGKGILVILLGLACAAGVFAIHKFTHGHDWRTLGLGFTIAAVILIALGLYLLVMAWRPFMIINPEIIQIRGIKNPIPWNVVNEVKIINTSGITTRFLVDSKTIDELGLRHHGGRANIDEKRGEIDVFSMVPRGFNRKTYSSLIKDYRSAALARRIFRENNIQPILDL